MIEYKIVASKIERFDYKDYIKARIFLEVQDLDTSEQLINDFVQEGFNIWSNNEYLSPEDIGLAIAFGWELLKGDDPSFDDIIAAGMDALRS